MAGRSTAPFQRYPARSTSSTTWPVPSSSFGVGDGVVDLRVEDRRRPRRCARAPLCARARRAARPRAWLERRRPLRRAPRREVRLGVVEGVEDRQELRHDVAGRARRRRPRSSAPRACGSSRTRPGDAGARRGTRRAGARPRCVRRTLRWRRPRAPTDSFSTSSLTVRPRSRRRRCRRRRRPAPRAR